MKEGNSSAYYGSAADVADAVRRQRQAVVTSYLPEDLGLSLRRAKPKSRFDMPYPPGSASSSRNWESDTMEKTQQQSKMSILEDYMLEDEDSSKGKRKYSNPDDNRGQWRDVTDEPERSNKKSEIPMPPPTSDANHIPPPGWHQNPVNNIEQLPPGGYPGYAQPPNYNQPPSYYQHQYDYQQYAGYHNYYQGYQDYSQSWGAASTDQHLQPPPPGLVLPDMSHPPPLPSLQSQDIPGEEQEESKRMPTPQPKQSPPSPPMRSRSSSPKPQKSQRTREDSKRSEAIEFFADDESKDAGLVSQRDSYLRKASKLKRELAVLRHTQDVMRDDGNVDNHILKENKKLQVEIQRKLKAIDNVINMLESIINNKNEKSSERKRYYERKESRGDSKSSRHSSSSSSSSDDEEEEERKKPRAKSESVEEQQPDEYNLTFFDPEEHWCSNCDVFPATAKEFLNHLHSAEHKQNKDPTDIPWHVNNVEQDRPYIRGAPTKRVPIRGLQFFVACQGWYCKLCSAWIGDLHCASMHLKSQRHMDNYKDFISKENDWEQKWSEKRKEAMKFSKQEDPLEKQMVSRRQQDKEEQRAFSRPEATMKSRPMWGDKKTAPSPVRESMKVLGHTDREQYESRRNEEERDDNARSIRVQMRNKPPPADSEIPMGPVLPPEMKSYSKSNPWESTNPSPPHSNGSSKEWGGKSQSVISEVEKQLVKNLKEKFKRKYDVDDYSSKKEDRKERKKEKKFRERSRDRSRSRERSRSRGRSRGRSRSHGHEYSRERDYSRSRSRERRSRSRSRERRRRRRSTSSHRGRSYSRSRSRSPERKSKKVEPRMWVAPPSSPPPYITRKTEDKDKWDKPKKKAVAPNPVANLPKSKLPFIGRMPLLKHIAKKKQPDDFDKSENFVSEINLSSERRAPEDMDIDSDASDNEQQRIFPEDTTSSTLHHDMQRTEEEEAVDVQRSASGIPLPQDFQDALCILFPDDVVYKQRQHQQVQEVMAPPLPKRDCNISAEELLMLGIDPEDMVAQGLSKF